ncbi:hypothetical protein ACIA8K_38455 [Catenuloplanes sp. NPDC051500]|uniref:hypothetical protein n=1 Tax=Catenuloplanes sp. NPDC051500 TaxID=3363959 RepID=UPI0037BA2D17
MLPVTATLATSGLLAALLLIQLRRQRQHRRLPAAPQPQTETTVRAAARPADVERLDHALRALTHLLRDTPTEDLPDIIAVWISSDALHLILTTPAGAAPSPFITDPAGTRWLLAAEAVLPAVDGDEVAPLQTLVTVASHPQGHHLLIDLERVGTLSLTGDPRQAADMLRYLATELATSTWSDDTDIIVTGLDSADVEHLIALGGHRLRTASATQAHTLMQHRTATSSADRLAARISHAHDAQPAPLVILAAGPDTATAVGLPGHALHDAEAIAATSRADIRFMLRVDADGTVDLDWLDPTGLYATGLPADQLANLARLFRSAQSRQPTVSAPVDEPVPAATEEWADGTDAHGHLLPAPGVVAPAAEPADTTRPKPAPTAATGTRRRRAPEDDAALDADLADWHNPATTRLRIAILGPVDVQAVGPPPDERLRFHREIVVYLASRGRHGATGEQLDAALWPETIVSPRSRRVAMSRTRRWLGEAPDGQPWLPPNNSIDRT